MTVRQVMTAVMLGLFLCTIANANVLEVRTADIGQSGGRTGGVADPLEVGDKLGVEVWLKWRPGTNYGGGAPNYSAYGGYWLDGLDLDMTVDGGTLAANSNITGPARHSHIAHYGAYNVSAATQAGSGTSVPVELSDPYGGNNAGAAGGPNDMKYMYGWEFTADGLGGNAGEVTISLQKDGAPTSSGTDHATNRYSDYTVSWFGYNNGSYTDLDQSNMGDASVNVVPEPATIIMMMLAGTALFMRRRKN